MCSLAPAHHPAIQVNPLDSLLPLRRFSQAPSRHRFAFGMSKCAALLCGNNTALLQPSTRPSGQQPVSWPTYHPTAQSFKSISRAIQLTSRALHVFFKLDDIQGFLFGSGQSSITFVADDIHKKLIQLTLCLPLSDYLVWVLVLIWSTSYVPTELALIQRQDSPISSNRVIPATFS